MKRSELLEYIERIGSLLRTGQRAGGGAHGLQAVHVATLQYLQRCNRYSNTPAALTAYLGSTKGTVSQSLKLLERDGYLSKTDDPVDGRVIHLLITAKGRKILQKLAPDTGWNEALAHLDEGDCRVAARALKTLLQHAQRANRYRTFGECHTCRHLLTSGGQQFRCGLTGDPLSTADTGRICFEHEPAEAI